MREPCPWSQEIDFASAEVRRNPYPVYRRLRDENPVAFLERMQWYAVTRHADVERVLRCPADFSSTIMRSADRALLGQDPPAHTRMRTIAARVFEGVRSQALYHRIEATARSLVREFVESGGGDFVSRIAIELPLRIVVHLLGIHESRLTDVKRWSDAVVLGASRMVPAGQEADVALRLEEFDRSFRDLIAHRRKQPGDDVISALVQAGETSGITEPDLRSLAKLLLIAGNETTTNLMSNAMVAMFETPGLQDRLRQEPALCGAWAEETLRFDAPVQIVLRRTQRDVELDGVAIRKGQIVAAVLGSANRDERRHPDPDLFRLDRRQPHLAFGAGPHACLGAALARLEATIGLSILLEQTRRIDPAEAIADCPLIPALQLRGPQRLLMAVA